MDAEVISRLLDINYQFYQKFSGSFSATRRRIQPGVARILDQLPLEANLLDLGCGNGEVAAALVRRGGCGAYLGIDFSPGLLEEAGAALSRAPANRLQASFQAANLADPAPVIELAARIQPVDAVLAFAVLHHLPGVAMRRNLLAAVREILRASGRPDAVFIHSVWQFLNSPRLAARVLPWEQAGLHAGQVDPGDALLDWRRDGIGLRYVHHYSEAELQQLADESGFRLRWAFFSDGAGGNLGLYQVWELA